MSARDGEEIVNMKKAWEEGCREGMKRSLTELKEWSKRQHDWIIKRREITIQPTLYLLGKEIAYNDIIIEINKKLETLKE